MLDFFRINDPLRFLVVILVLIMIRIFFYWQEFPIIAPEVVWNVTAQRMLAGEFLYRDIWENIAPLSAAVYWGIESIFLNSQKAYHYIASFLVVWQALLLNGIFQRREIFNEKNYVTAILYVILIHFSLDTFTLSPTLMGLTCLLLALQITIKTEENIADSNLFRLGFWVGMSFLFEFSFLPFLLWLTLGIAILKALSLRKLTLLLYGFIFPSLLLWLYYFVKNKSSWWIDSWFWASWADVLYVEMPFKEIVLASAIFLAISVASFLVSYNGGYTNYQTNLNKSMLIWIVCSFLSFFLSQYRMPFQFLSLIVPTIYYLMRWLLSFRKRLWAELWFFGFFVLCIAWTYHNTIQPIPKICRANFESALIDTRQKPILSNQSILLLGYDIHLYYFNNPVTPYQNWYISKDFFMDMDSYQNVLSIYKSLSQHKPQYIIDKAGVMDILFQKIPIIHNLYEKDSLQKEIIKLKK